jgi:hypothetical protein
LLAKDAYIQEGRKMTIKQQRVRIEPRISVTKLGELIEAGHVRKERILKNAKRPPDYVVTYYKDAAEVLADSIVASFDRGIIGAGRLRLERSAATTDYEKARLRNNIEALVAAERMFGSLKHAICKMMVKHGVERPPHLRIEGVSVSVRPELVLWNDKGFGAIKLFFAKGEDYSINRSVGLHIATLLHQHVETSSEGVADRKNCLVVDVFRGTIHEAPASYKRRRAEAEAACRYIAYVWDRLPTE